MKTIYIMMCGLSLSGKTVLVEKISKRFPKKFFVLDSRSIHDYLNQFEVYQDDNSISGASFKLRQETTDAIQKSLIDVLTKNGICLIHDSCNRKKVEREERMKMVKSRDANIQTMIIFVNTDFETIKERAKTEDQKLIENNREAVWLDLVNKQNESFDVPTKDESDMFFEFSGSDESAIFEYLGNILNT